jgi:nitrate/nitrite transporter NarK
LTQKSSPDKSTLTFILSKLDAPGFVLFAPFSTMLLMALQWGGTEYPWNSPTIIGLFCGAAGTFILFLAWEYRTNEAMLPFSLLKRRIVWSSCLTVAFFFGSSLIFSYYLPIYFQAVRNVSPALSGVYILPSILTQILMSVVSGVLGKPLSSS